MEALELAIVGWPTANGDLLPLHAAALVLALAGLAWWMAGGWLAGLGFPHPTVALANLTLCLTLVLAPGADPVQHPLHWLAGAWLELGGLVLLWSVALRLVGESGLGWELPATAAVDAALLAAAVAAGPVAGVAEAVLVPAVLALQMLLLAWLVVRAGWQLVGRLHQAGQGGTAALCAVVAAALLLAVAWRWAGMATEPADRLGLGAALLAFATLANLLLAHAAVGPMMRQSRQLCERDPVTGLADAASVLRAMEYEWQRFQRTRSGAPALLSVSADRMNIIDQEWGDAAAESVVQAVARVLRPLVPPGALLGHAGDGRFLVLMPRTPLPVAVSLAKRLCQAVAADPRLHPAGDDVLTLSIGAAPGRIDQPRPMAVLDRAEAQRLCAVLAGGNRVEWVGQLRNGPTPARTVPAGSPG